MVRARLSWWRLPLFPRVGLSRYDLMPVWKTWALEAQAMEEARFFACGDDLDCHFQVVHARRNKLVPSRWQATGCRQG